MAGEILCGTGSLSIICSIFSSEVSGQSAHRNLGFCFNFFVALDFGRPSLLSAVVFNSLFLTALDSPTSLDFL
ncbi:hypothetical protein BY996DRAFT_8391726 [Phakopsora pachyrhizi]|nr:hypothetical protein BY996DRAFT_8391726 [Phakopsora pachyrhizi]